MFVASTGSVCKGKLQEIMTPLQAHISAILNCVSIVGWRSDSSGVWQSAAAALPVYDEVEMNTWMASLTGDPGMAALLEPIVAPPQVSKASLTTCYAAHVCKSALPASCPTFWTRREASNVFRRDGAHQYVFGTCRCILPLSLTSAGTYPDLRSNVCVCFQGMEGYDEGEGINEEMPCDVQLDELYDSSPSQQHPPLEVPPEMEHVQNDSQQGAACSSQEPDQAGTPAPVDSSQAATLAAPLASGGPPLAPDLAAAAATAGRIPQAPNEALPDQASSHDARPPAAAQKARRRLSLEPVTFPPAAAAPAPKRPAAARPLREETGAASAAPHMTTAQPVQGELFAEAASSPIASPYEQEPGNGDSGDRRATKAEASSATPKLSLLLSDPMSTLDGFSAHVLAAKARAAVPSADPSAAATNAGDTPEAQQVADAQQSVEGEGAASTRPSKQKGRSCSTARGVSASNADAQNLGVGFFGDPVSTLDGFQGDILATSGRAATASAGTAQPSASKSPAAETAAACQGMHAQEQQQFAQPNAARGRASQRTVTQQRRGRKASAATGVPAARATPIPHGAGIFGDPINTLDGFSGEILSARAAAASADRPQGDVAVSIPSNSGLSFLDAMPTLDGFPADESDAAAAREGSRRLPGSYGAAAALQALSPIPLRIGPDGRLSSGPAMSCKVDSSAGTVPAEWRGGPGVAGAGRVALPGQAQQGREDTHSGQERGIWRSEESMDAVLNQDAFRDPSPAPEQAAAAAQMAPRQSDAAPVDAPATDFSGLRARIGSIAKGSSCAQQQGGGNARALSSIFAGGASAESLDAFMRSLKY